MKLSRCPPLSLAAPQRLPRTNVALVLAAVLAAAAGLHAAPIEHPSGPDEACVDCHDGLLDGSTRHMPAEDEGCDICHSIKATNDGAEVFSASTDDSPELCLECHDGVGDRMAEGALHPILDGEACTLCHDPHSSDEAGLLNQPIAALCGDCHETAEEAAGLAVQHRPVLSPGCGVCHDPHAAPVASLLRAPVNQVCLTCHGAPLDAEADLPLPIDPAAVAEIGKIFLGPDKIFGHPLVGHPVADPPAPSPQDPAVQAKPGPEGIPASQPGPPVPTPSRPPLDCLTCHEAHASEQPDLMRSDPNLCEVCHQ